MSRKLADLTDPPPPRPRPPKRQPAPIERRDPGDVVTPDSIQRERDDKLKDPPHKPRNVR
jgi:hypothetical protein